MLAAGGGVRFGGVKQFELLGGRRLVDRSVEVAADVCDAIVVVLPPGARWDGVEVAAAVPGGATKPQSLRAGLAAVPPDVEVVVVHLASHPLAARALLLSVLAPVLDGAVAAAPVLPVTETVLRVRSNIVDDLVPRRGLALLQSPHAFRAAVLRDAHRDEPDDADDISLLHRLGYPVVTVRGDPTNVHVTTHDELDLARLLAASGGPGGG